MFFEDDLPRKAKTLLNSPVLDTLSVAELEAYILDLNGEIERVKTDIAKKQAHQKAASDIFKK